MDHHANRYACAYAQCDAFAAAPRLVGVMPGTSVSPTPVVNAVSSAGTEPAGNPAPVAAAETLGAQVLPSLPLMMASRTAEPKAPPMARAEKARPVAVLR